MTEEQRLRIDCAEALGYDTEDTPSRLVYVIDSDAGVTRKRLWHPDKDPAQLVELIEFYGEYGSIHLNAGAEIYEFQPYYDYLINGMKSYKQKGGDWKLAIMRAVAEVSNDKS